MVKALDFGSPFSNSLEIPGMFISPLVNCAIMLTSPLGSTPGAVVFIFTF